MRDQLLVLKVAFVVQMREWNSLLILLYPLLCMKK